MKIHNLERGVMAEMNMIPLIDVALILLIIFMVMTPFLVQSQIKVDLPNSAQGPQASSESSVKVEITAGGQVYVEGRRTTMARLEDELILRLSKSSKKTVLVEADKSVPVQEVIRVFDAAKKLGAGKLGIGVVSKN